MIETLDHAPPIDLSICSSASDAFAVRETVVEYEQTIDTTRHDAFSLSRSIAAAVASGGARGARAPGGGVFVFDEHVSSGTAFVSVDSPTSKSARVGALRSGLIDGVSTTVPMSIAALHVQRSARAR